MKRIYPANCGHFNHRQQSGPIEYTRTVIVSFSGNLSSLTLLHYNYSPLQKTLLAFPDYDF